MGSICQVSGIYLTILQRGLYSTIMSRENRGPYWNSRSGYNRINCKLLGTINNNRKIWLTHTGKGGCNM